MEREDWVKSVESYEEDSEWYTYEYYRYGRFHVTECEGELNEVLELVRGDWVDVTDDHYPYFDFTKDAKEYL